MVSHITCQLAIDTRSGDQGPTARHYQSYSQSAAQPTIEMYTPLEMYTSTVDASKQFMMQGAGGTPTMQLHTLLALTFVKLLQQEVLPGLYGACKVRSHEAAPGSAARSATAAAARFQPGHTSQAPWACSRRQS